jgi:alanine-synthesizing transaminase
MFLWAPIPERFRQLGSVEFSKLLLAKARVAVAPGLGFGEHGDGHVRIALVENNHRIRQALRGIKAFLAGDNLGPALQGDNLGPALQGSDAGPKATSEAVEVGAA